MPENGPSVPTVASGARRHAPIPAYDLRLWELVAVVVLTLLAGVVAASAVSFALGGSSPEKAARVARSETFMLSFVALTALGTLASVYMIIIMRKRLSWRRFGFRPLRRKAVLIAFGAGILIVPTMALIGGTVQRALGLPNESPQLAAIAPEGFSWIALVGMLVLGGFVVPLVEEMVFRGMLFAWLRRSMRVWPAALVSGGLFGLMHGYVSVIVATAFVGVVLALAYEWTRSLWAPLIIHATQNSIAIAVMFATIA